MLKHGNNTYLCSFNIQFNSKSVCLWLFSLISKIFISFHNVTGTFKLYSFILTSNFKVFFYDICVLSNCPYLCRKYFKLCLNRLSAIKNGGNAEVVNKTYNSEVKCLQQSFLLEDKRIAYQRDQAEKINVISLVKFLLEGKLFGLSADTKQFE